MRLFKLILTFFLKNYVNNKTQISMYTHTSKFATIKKNCVLLFTYFFMYTHISKFVTTKKKLYE